MIKILLTLTLCLLVSTEAIAQSTVPNFSFTNYDSQEVSNQTLKGKFFLLNFFFTSCPKICPMLNGKIATLQATVSSSKLNFVSVSVDPENDSLEKLADYATRMKADPKRWFFVRGNNQQVIKLIDDLKLAAGENINDHNTRILLVDPEGQILGYYPGLDTESFQELQAKLAELLP